MSNELADRLENVLNGLENLRYDAQIRDDKYDFGYIGAMIDEQKEAIAALRSEPVAEIELSGGMLGVNFTDIDWKLKATDGTKLYAAPSRETATEVPVHSKSQYKRVAAQGGNPVLSRETDQRESNSNPAPMHGQSKTGLTGSHPGAPTPTAEPALSAEHIEQWKQRMNDLQAIGVAMPPGSNVLADMALSSLTARDDGIEAAAKVCDVEADRPEMTGPYRYGAGMCASKIRKLKGASHD